MKSQGLVKQCITYCRCGVRSQISGWCSPSRVRSRPSSCRRALLSAAAGGAVLLTAVTLQNFAKHFASLEQVCGEHSREFSRWVLALIKSRNVMKEKAYQKSESMLCTQQHKA